jgi:hypothetical protein
MRCSCPDPVFLKQYEPVFEMSKAYTCGARVVRQFEGAASSSIEKEDEFAAWARFSQKTFSHNRMHCLS